MSLSDWLKRIWMPAPRACMARQLPPDPERAEEYRRKRVSIPSGAVVPPGFWLYFPDQQQYFHPIRVTATGVFNVATGPYANLAGNPGIPWENGWEPYRELTGKWKK